MSKVSVVVPNYNHGRFLRQRINSILSQTFQDFELILLDDASTDDSRSILSSYASDPHVLLEFNERNSGSTFKQWNKGVHLARGEYVWIAESDDYADIHFLEHMVPVLDSKPAVVWGSCRSWEVNGNGQLKGYADSNAVDLARYECGLETDGRAECRNYFLRVNPVCNASSVLFRKAVYEQVGGTDEGFRLCGDWKLWAAMALKGRIAYIREPLNYFRCHDGSVRFKSSQMNLDVLEYLAVMRWVLKSVTGESISENFARCVANMWVPAVMSFHVPLKVKREILQNVWELDPHPIRNSLHPAWRTVQRKLLRHWRSFQMET